MATATEKEIQDLREELSALRTELANIGETVSSIAHTAASEGGDRVRKAAESSREQARQTVGAFEREIEARPMTSVATAFGVGFILGKLLDR